MNVDRDWTSPFLGPERSWTRRFLCFVLGHRLGYDYETCVVTCRRCSRVAAGFWREGR